MSLNSPLEAKLRSGLNVLGLETTDPQCRSLLAYLELLLKWNKVYNLTAVREPEQMVVRHLLDSLAVAPWCNGERLIDVGTGAGLPGVPLAILYPDKEFHLLDSNSKKTRFLFQAKTVLNLQNISVHHSRVESFSPTHRYDAVLSRAFASLVDMVKGASHLLGDSGVFIAMKGEPGELELAAITRLGYLSQLHELQVPGLDERRSLVIISGKQSG